MTLFTLYLAATATIDREQAQQVQNAEDDTYDVLANYHERNRAPRPPKPKRLRDIRRSGQQRQSSDVGDNVTDAGSGSESDDESSQKARAKRHSQKAYNRTSDDPKRFRYYPPQWRKVLTRAKNNFRLWMATECGFPDKSNQEHYKAVTDCLHRALYAHQEGGGRVEHGSFSRTFFCGCSSVPYCRIFSDT